jgi:CheY-specific phosphatase CheX
MPETVVTLSRLEPDALLAALADALETMAFVSLAPADPSAAAATPPADPLRIRIGFAGPARGSLEMIAPRALGRLVLSNARGDAPDDVSDPEAEDALRETMNVWAGALFRVEAGDDQFDITLPAAAPAAPADWPPPGAQIVETECGPVAVRCVLND